MTTPLSKIGLLALAASLLPVAPVQAQNFVWAKQMGGPQADVAYDVTADAVGNSYFTGYFNGTVDFDPGPGVVNLTSAGDDDIVVAKLDSAGNLVWARRMGGNSAERGSDIAVDSAGNVYTTGWFEGTADFDPGAGVSNLTAAGGENSFVSKLDSNGNFVWAKRLGGTGDSEGDGIAVDGAGNVYTAGYFDGSADFDPGAGTVTLTSAGNEDVFVSKLDGSGNFVWARRMGGSSYDFAVGLALDANGNVYTTGTFNGSGDFDPGAGTATLTSAGEDDVFVSKLDGSGNFVWAKRFGGAAPDYSYSIAVDGGGNVVTTGAFYGSVDFDPGAGVSALTTVGEEDIFISKLSSAGAFVWARRVGGSGFEFGSAVAIDGSGNVYTTGLFRGTADFDPGAGVSNLTSAGGDEIFVLKLDSAGAFGWAQRMGGSVAEHGKGIAVDGSGNVYTVGLFMGTADFDPGAGAFNMNAVGGNDIFISKLSGETPGLLPVITEGGVVLANLLPTVNTLSPLSIISVFGKNFSTETILYPTLDNKGKLGTVLGGTCLMMNGQALPIFAVTPTQINAQTSATKAYGPASFTVVANCGTAAALSSAPVTIEMGRAASPAPHALTSGVEMVTVEEATPAFFIFNPVAANGYIAARFNAAGSQAPVPVAPANVFPNDSYGPSRPAKPGDVVLLYGTGWGDTTAHLGTGVLASGAAPLLPVANPSITFGGIALAPADILYVGATPGTAGLYQAAIRIPNVAQAGNKQVVLTVYGKSTPVGPVVPVALQ